MFSFKQDKLKNVETENINEIDIETAEEKKLFRLLNILLIVILLVSVMISIDIVCVTKYHKGPFFAIRTHVYKDGGTKVYHGIGYKVIKYNQKVGRRDIAIGFWTMPYNTKPTFISILDLALELGNNPQLSYKKYAKKFLEVEGEVDKVDLKKKQLTLRYVDDGNKYSLDMICTMAENNEEIMVGDTITVIGTVTNYSLRNTTDKNSANILNMENCFAK